MATSAPPFIFDIQEVWPTDPWNYDHTGHWLPPDLTIGQLQSPYARRFYRWNACNNQSVTEVTQPTNDSIYRQATMYHCGGRFWIVPYDATQYNVRQTPPGGPWYPGWRALTFDHLANSVSSVGHALSQETLATQRAGQAWCRQLFPDGYLASQPTSQPGGLQGDLALILALGAFSAPSGKSRDAIATSFKVGHWRPHSLSQDLNLVRENRRGFVVTVYVDPTSSGTALKAFENGQYGGPIFA